MKDYDNIKRCALVIFPNQPFFDWVNSIDPWDSNDEFFKEGEVYLLPDLEEKEQMERC